METHGAFLLLVGTKATCHYEWRWVTLSIRSANKLRMWATCADINAVSASMALHAHGRKTASGLVLTQAECNRKLSRRLQYWCILSDEPF